MTLPDSETPLVYSLHYAQERQNWEDELPPKPGPAPAVPLPPFPVTPMVLLLTRFCMVLPYPAQFPTKK